MAATKGPSMNPADRRLAVEVEDHPLDHGDLEGTIPLGQYGGGKVMLWDRGYWEPEPGTDPHEGLKNGDPKIVMEGERLKGGFAPPQLARSADRPPQGAGWGHEIKFDGYRLQLRVEGGRATLKTRTGLDWTARFSEIGKDGHALADCLIDGEACALDQNGSPDFAALQAALSDGKTGGRMSLEGIVSERLDAPYRSDRSDTRLKSKCRAGHEVVIGGWTGEAGPLRSLLAGGNKGGKLAYVVWRRSAPG